MQLLGEPARYTLVSHSYIRLYTLSVSTGKPSPLWFLTLHDRYRNQVPRLENLFHAQLRTKFQLLEKTKIPTNKEVPCF